MLGETVHAYILTPALAIAVPRLRTLPRLVAVAGVRLSNPQLSQWDEEISRLTALVTRKPIRFLANVSSIICPLTRS